MDGPAVAPLETGRPSGREIDLPQLPSRLVFQTIPIPVMLLDSEGCVRHMNRAAKSELDALVGCGHGIGHALHCIHYAGSSGGCGASPDCQDCALQAQVVSTLETGLPHRQAEVKVVSHRNGEHRDHYLLVSTETLEWAEERLILVCLEDVTARKIAELDLRKTLKEVDRLKAQLQQENVTLRAQVQNAGESDEIVGDSEDLKLMLRKARYVGATDANVLITGETGTGKELLARVVHRCSQRKDRMMITVNCAALSSSLIESELFGHVAGAFTGALSEKVGRFELADGGTLFLDEIGELSPELQAKLLRVLQEGQFERVGSSKTLTADVRIIAATNRHLREDMERGVFRADLYYRLAVFPIELPPLRVRRSDIPALVRYFVKKAEAQVGKRIDVIPDEVMDALTRYDWPGNIRELENVIERSVILSPGKMLKISDPLDQTRDHRELSRPNESLESIDRAHILAVLEDSGWRINGSGNAADRLGLKPSTLRSRMEKLGIARPSR
jgi:transcriptional regulator with GAF, ATPase, and Fis domain